MTEQEKWHYVLSLEEKLLNGGVILSEWTTFLVRDAQTAFCAGANISSILTCQAALESHLRFDYFAPETSENLGFYRLIEQSSLDSEDKAELHELRRFRNKWVHIADPADDNSLLEKPDYHEAELEEFATNAIKVLLKTLYRNPWI